MTNFSSEKESLLSGEAKVSKNKMGTKNSIQDYSFVVVEPNEDESIVDRVDYLTKIVLKFQDHLAERSRHYLGYPANLNCHHFVALSPFLQFAINNIGDPFKESNNGLHSKKFEVAVLEWLTQLWGIEKDDYWGYVTNGGTEANLHGLFVGRELHPDGILYTSRESHYSIFKAARMYRMKCEKIKTLTSGEMDCSDFRERLLLNKDKPAIINVTIGTTFKGGLDNLGLVIETLQECGFSNNQFYIHCDAALSGFIIPFLNQEPKYTFKKPIGSLSISCHKFLGCPMPCGVQLTRKNHNIVLSESIESILDTTVSGSRNGHAPLFIWYALSIRGRKGLEKDVENCMRNARYMRDRLKSEGISSMLNEMSNIVIFERPIEPDFIRLWQLQCCNNMAHVVVMPHVTTEMLDRFLEDLMQRRKIWYRSGEIQPPCLAEDIGVSNCACPVHGEGKRYGQESQVNS